MKEPIKKKNENQKVTEVTTNSVQFVIKQVNENLIITTNKSAKQAKNQIINQAFKYHSQNNIQEAAKYYKFLINNGLADHRIFSNYGIILKDLGNFKKAEIYSRKAIKINRNYADAHSNLGLILSYLGKSKEAEISLRKAIQLNPSLAEAHCNLGRIQIDFGNFKDAELSLRKAIELKPNLVKSHFLLASIFIQEERLTEAEMPLRKAIELNPDIADFHSNLGLILSYLGQSEEAELSLFKAISLILVSFKTTNSRFITLSHPSELLRMST